MLKPVAGNVSPAIEAWGISGALEESSKNPHIGTPHKSQALVFCRDRGHGCLKREPGK